MKPSKVDANFKKKLQEARGMIGDVAKADGNEAETRRRVERFFESLMGYDVFKHITREHAVHGVGDTEHCDFAIQLEQGDKAKPVILVELKRINVELSPNHLKQVASYAINIGCEWTLLTNGKQWSLYHVSFGQPPQTKLVDSWDIMLDEPAILYEKFCMIGYHNVRRGALNLLWEKKNVLTPQNVLKVILSESSISMMRRELKRKTGVAVTPEEIVSAVRHLLNEAAAIEMDNIRIALPKTQPKKAKTKPPETIAETKPSMSEDAVKTGRSQ